jgi:hypothetical protein
MSNLTALRSERKAYSDAYKILRTIGEFEGPYIKSAVAEQVRIRVDDFETPELDLVRKYVALNDTLIKRKPSVKKVERLIIDRPLTWDKAMQVAAVRAQYQCPIISVNASRKSS